VIKRHDYLIEGITQKLASMFEPTHNISIRTSDPQTAMDIPANSRTEIIGRFIPPEIERPIGRRAPRSHAMNYRKTLTTMHLNIP